MEVRNSTHVALRHVRYCLLIIFLLMANVNALHAQGIRKYSIRNGGMEIALSKDLKEAELKEFIEKYDLSYLSLERLIRSNFKDSVNSNGWRIELNNKELLVLSKPLFAAEDSSSTGGWLNITGIFNAAKGNDAVPPGSEALGSNSFKKHKPFNVNDSVVTFVVRTRTNAKNMLLAGVFTNWFDHAIPMTLTDSGWVAKVKLAPGKYTYKFIADGNWFLDPDNGRIENDGEGNDNSVFYVTNTTFKLAGFSNAKKVILAGSFNNWDEGKVRLTKTAAGWEVPVFLSNGTYTYRYIVDGRWMTDPGNPNRTPNEFDDYNSVISIGKPTVFVLDGLKDAKKVFLTGSFNAWQQFELPMTKTATGWQISYVLSAGNYEYKFVADGHLLDAEGNEVGMDKGGSLLVIEPNYTFKLKKYLNAKFVFVAGDFNGWAPHAGRMKKEGDEWVLQMHLSPGKHLYKFVVDGQWIKDPDNELWEENEFNTGNSIMWFK